MSDRRTRSSAPARSQPTGTGEPRIWQRLAEIHGRSGPKEVVFENSLGVPLAAPLLDLRGMLLSTGEHLGANSTAAVDWFAKSLKLRLAPKLRAALRELTASFFSGSRDAAAWVYFESCRDPIARQAPGVQQFRLGDAFPMPDFPLRPRGNYTFNRDDPRVEPVSLPLGALRFHDYDGARKKKKLIRFDRLRAFHSPELRLRGDFETYCLADLDGEKHLIDEGKVPAGLGLLDESGINVGQLINWVKLGADGLVSAFTIELHPGSAELLSVRRTKVPFELLLRIHPRYEEWFCRAIGGTRPVATEPEPLPVPATLAALLPGVVDLFRDPGRLREYRRSLQVLCYYAQIRSLRGTGMNAELDRKGVANHLKRLQKLFGLPMYDSEIGRARKRNESRPTEEAILLGDWLLQNPALLGWLGPRPR